MSIVKKRLGFVGWRGMVGSVLLNRLLEEDELSCFESYFYSTSQAGQKAPSVASFDTLKDANNLEELAAMDIIVTCQGGDYTKSVHQKLRQANWKGFWVDAASTLRMESDSVLVLDPLNLNIIRESIHEGKRDFVGPNCTVSLMLLALERPIKEGLIDWIGSHTYQAASGAGARNMKELLKQMGHLYNSSSNEINDDHSSILELDKKISLTLQSDESFPKDNFMAPLAGSLIPWIDSKMDNGQTREEWKAMVEANKILGLDPGTLRVDGTCVRIGAMRSHSQALVVKCKKSIKVETLRELLQDSHPWLRYVPNEKEDTLKNLTPAATSGTLDIAIGRVRSMNLGPDFFNAFTVGDQLLWGAAEPLKRTLKIIAESDC